MSQRALITRRAGGTGAAPARASASLKAESLGLTVEASPPHATLVSGSAKQYAELEAQGFRVKVLPDTNILSVGSYRIDVEAAAPKVPAALEVPAALKDAWPHHLVQLVGPPNQEWIRAVEAEGVDVVEPVSAYGLLVACSPAEAKSLKALPFVVWVGPFKPAYRVAPNVKGLTGVVRFLSVGVYPESAVDETADGIRAAGGKVVEEERPPETYKTNFGRLHVEIDASKIQEVARLPYVRWVEFHGPDTLLDERSCQITAENLDGAAAPNNAPVVGYQGALAGLGLNGAGVTIGIVDSGVDTHDNATLHPDLAGRMVTFVDASGGATPVDRDGHGTHVAGIAVGNAATGDTDAGGFLLGQGVAPAAQFVSVNAIGTGGPGLTDDNRVLSVVNNNGQVMNNSWGGTNSAGSGYTARSRTYDQRVRDPNAGAAGLEYLVVVSAAGNDGPLGATSINNPWEAKNPIVVGNSRNFRPGEFDNEIDNDDDIRGISSTSSRGPAVDGRTLPTIVAPGSDIISARPNTDGNPGTPGVQRPRTPYTDTNGAVHQNHFRNGGTSMASPHVAGLCALLIEWWRNRTGGRNPSPAMLKALLVNGAEDLVGGPDGTGGTLPNIPNNLQGWGRVSLENIVLGFPASDRGPKIFSDQRHAFTADGQEFIIRVAPADTTRPMRVTLVWTDAPGAANASPALVNDLDLEVTQTGTANVFKGNVFSNGFSVTGGNFDALNNVECVYVQNPTGTYDVRVVASALTGNARPPFDNTPWQDFALVIDNAVRAAASPVNVVPVIDRSGSMVGSGYVEVTRRSSKQFIDLLGAGDTLGVVSFGDTGTVEFPAGGPPALQNVMGQATLDAAKDEVDGIAFDGCTFMGDGILKARDMLAPAPNPRAMVLLSDGYDNRGCDPANPSKPSAINAASSLVGIPVYTCAMGPASDQALLQQIADLTGGRYYFMPTIDDLFEIYNYIRARITDTGVIVNESALASSSRVGAFVDALATEVTFSVAWADPRLRFVPFPPRKAGEICVRLRDPRGRLLHPQASDLRRNVGDGYVILHLEEPVPGQWFVEVETSSATHTRYTVGGFVRSPLRLLLSLGRTQFVAGMRLPVVAQVFNGPAPLRNFRADTRVNAPVLGLLGLLSKHKNALKSLRPPASFSRDALPGDLGKLFALRDKLLRDKKPDIFARAVNTVSLKDATFGRLQDFGLAHLLPFTQTPFGNGSAQTPSVVAAPTTPARAAAATVAPATAHGLPPSLGPLLNNISGALLGLFDKTSQQGTYNVAVTASGVTPDTNTRYVRKDLVSVLVN